MRTLSRSTKAKAQLSLARMEVKNRRTSVEREKTGLKKAKTKLLRLKGLGKTPAPEEVDKIYGEGVTKITCDECNKEVKRAVCFNCPRGGVAIICKKCVQKAASLLAEG